SLRRQAAQLPPQSRDPGIRDALRSAANRGRHANGPDDRFGNRLRIAEFGSQRTRKTTDDVTGPARTRARPPKPTKRRGATRAAQARSPRDAPYHQGNRTMAFFSLSKWLNRKTKASEQGETRFRRLRRRLRRLNLERLEDRLAPAQTLSYTLDPADQAVTLQLASVMGVETLQIVKDMGGSALNSQALSDTSNVQITGASGHSNQLTINFASGDFFASASLIGGITFTGNSGDTDTLVVKGSGTTATSTTANYAPSATVAGSGAMTIAGAPAADPITSIGINFSGLTAAAALTTVQDMASYTLTPQGTAASLTVSKPAAGQNKVSGTSGVSIVPTTFFNIPTVTLD